MTALQELIDFCRPFRVCSSHECARMDKLCEVLKRFLRTDMEQWLRLRLEAPVAEVYSSDATPLRCKQDFMLRSGDFKVRRRGNHSGEYLVERL